MRRIINSLVILLTLIAPVTLLIPSTAGAIDVLPTCKDAVAKDADYCKDAGTQTTAGNNPIISFIKLAINIVSYIGGAAAVIVLIVSAIRMIVSNGDSNAVTAARSGVIYSLVGISVIVLAQTLVIFVLDKIK